MMMSQNVCGKERLRRENSNKYSFIYHSNIKVFKANRLNELLFVYNRIKFPLGCQNNYCFYFLIKRLF